MMFQHRSTEFDPRVSAIAGPGEPIVLDRLARLHLDVFYHTDRRSRAGKM